MALITCRNVSFAYEGSVAVSGLNFAVNPGDYLCVVGENGSGKSTLLKGLLHLIRPREGELTLGGGLRANEIGYLPQQTAAQKDFPASVYEVALSGYLAQRGARPFYTKREKAGTLENLNRLGALDLRRRCYRELSGGQQQRVLLARALAATRRLLVLDEPVAGLDPVATAELYRLIRQINRESGVTVVMVSHDVRSAAAYATHILHLRGEQLFFGTANAYRESGVGKNFMGDSAHD
ncbi:MAG: metal ABC transporter ATP-binding protein [Oscillospiraceae bacterium]|jgi:zinc transport system ATP-binding protein|nr:metal ABC transporter ATP-binding protein [Oscillospiraceae bacterium]